MLGVGTLSPSLTLPSKLPQLPFQQSSRRIMSLRATATAVAVAVEVSDRRSLYQVLRVRQNASQVEIKTAYRTLAKLYHPDATARFMASSPPDGRDFIEIRNAYETLSDPNARAVYDLELNAVDSKRRRWGAMGGAYGVPSPGRGRFHPTRRWETDQCW